MRTQLQLQMLHHLPRQHQMLNPLTPILPRLPVIGLLLMSELLKRPMNKRWLTTISTISCDDSRGPLERCLFMIAILV